MPLWDIVIWDETRQRYFCSEATFDDPAEAHGYLATTEPALMLRTAYALKLQLVPPAIVAAVAARQALCQRAAAACLTRTTWTVPCQPSQKLAPPPCPLALAALWPAG
ncbi:hypothetical protein LRH25_25510 [Ideonella azotifigens]|nr:hypothetical protein [Ideonella azotifigens]MCD2343684.1 hypothetical protein [Ideonella azotifigens]